MLGVRARTLTVVRAARMVRPTGFEPVAYSSGGCRSIQLSYGRAVSKVITNTHEIAYRSPRRCRAIEVPAPSSSPYGKIPSSMYDRATLSIALTKAAVRRSGIRGSRRLVSRS